MQTAPSLIHFLIRLDLVYHEAGVREDERCHEVVPKRVADEVELVQFVPRGRRPMTLERFARLLTLPDQRAGFIIDPDPVRQEMATETVAGKGRYGN